MDIAATTADSQDNKGQCCHCRHRSMSFDGQQQPAMSFMSTFSSQENLPRAGNKGNSAFSEHRAAAGSKPCTASIFSRNLRSNSWRNLTSIGRVAEHGGTTCECLNKSQLVKKVIGGSHFATILWHCSRKVSCLRHDFSRQCEEEI